MEELSVGLEFWPGKEKKPPLQEAQAIVLKLQVAALPRINCSVLVEGVGKQGRHGARADCRNNSHNYRVFALILTEKNNNS